MSRALLAALVATSALTFTACTDSGGAAPSDASAADVGPIATDASDDASIAEDAPSGLPIGRVDRAGRAGINLILDYGDERAKEAYNKETTFQPTHGASFGKALAALDALDGQNDWTPDGGPHPLEAPLALDALVVDTAIACTAANQLCEHGYLEIERELLSAGPAHLTCGGRTLPDDALDVTMRWLIHKDRVATTDGVDGPTKQASRTFPYLAAPN